MSSSSEEFQGQAQQDTLQPESDAGAAIEQASQNLERIVGDVVERLTMPASQFELSLFKQVFESVSEPILITGLDGRITHVNQAYLNTTGYQRDEVIGLNPRVSSSGLHEPQFYKIMWQSIVENGSWKGEVWDRRRNGEVFPKLLSIDTVYDDHGNPQRYVGIFMDISDIKAAEKHLEEMAYFDRLTRLPNRTLLLERIEAVLNREEDGDQYAAIFFLDLDSFKKINDFYGHRMGDQLLVEISGRLKRCISHHDTVGRLAGDEFLVLMEYLGTDLARATNEIVQTGDNMLFALAADYRVAEKTIRSSASIGVTLFNRHSGDTVESLLTKADTAMYEAKKNGRNNLRFFDPEMQRAMQERNLLEAKLQTAVRNGAFELVFQPQMNAIGVVVGVEALMRWRDEDRGYISPTEFIPLAEEIRLIGDIGRWLLSEVCKMLKQWQADPILRLIPVAVNISGEHFNSDHFASDVEDIVDQHGVYPSQLKIELTESTVVKNVDESIAKMLLLQQRGFRFSMDDFGTGYSSLAYLQRLPFDQIKIDQSFVRDMLEDASDAFIVHSVINLTDMLQIEAIPEGVETQAHYHRLIDMGAKLFQGYLFSKPLPRQMCEVFIREHS